MDGQGEVLLPLRVLRRCGEDAHVPPFLAERGRNDQVARLDPGPQGFHARRFRQDEVDVLRLPEGNLGVHVKFPDGFNLIVKKLQAHGMGGLERENVQNAAAAGPLPAGNDLRNALEPRLLKQPYQIVRGVRFSRFQGHSLVLHAVGGGNLVIQAAFRQNDGLPAHMAGSDAVKDVQPFRGKLRVSHFLPQGHLFFRDEEDVAHSPCFQLRGKGFLRAQMGRDHPGPGGVRNGPDAQGRHERNPGQGGMVENRLFLRAQFREFPVKGCGAGHPVHQGGYGSVFCHACLIAPAGGKCAAFPCHVNGFSGHRLSSGH